MSNLSLIDSLNEINWDDICSESTKEVAIYSGIEESLSILSTWLGELISNHECNPALPFLYEAHVSLNDFCSSISLGLYKLSASSLRIVLESFLNFSYYKDHPVELNTLISNDSFYLGKAEIIEYHLLHTPQFNERSRQLDTINKLNIFYKEISQVIHGQIPGKWHTCMAFLDRKYDKDSFQIVASKFCNLSEIINLFLISSLKNEEWINLNHRSKKLFFKGMSKEKKIKIKRS